MLFRFEEISIEAKKNMLNNVMVSFFIILILVGLLVIKKDSKQRYLHMNSERDI